jgi:hypothetical protein
VVYFLIEIGEPGRYRKVDSGYYSTGKELLDII